MVKYNFYRILKKSFILHFLNNETFCPTFCQKASAAEAEAEGISLRSTPDFFINLPLS